MRSAWLNTILSLAAGGLMPCGPALAAPRTAAPAYAQIAAFNPAATPKGGGLAPLAGPILKAGRLYGTTSTPGTAFALTPPAAAGGSWTQTPLAALGQETALPLLSVSAASLAGVEPKDVFLLTLTKTGLYHKTVLYSFPAGVAPSSGLVLLPGGVLAGTASGTSKPDGLIYGLTPPSAGQTAWTASTLFAFSGGIEGAVPKGAIVAVGGALYGTTTYGGSAVCFFTSGPTGCGTIYRLSATAGHNYSETVLHSFRGGADGEGPGGLISANGRLYGTTAGGGNGHGTVYSVTLPTAAVPTPAYAVIYKFTDGTDGQTPVPGLAASTAGALFGMAQGGSSKQGTVFDLAPPAAAGGAWSFTLLHSFTGKGEDGAAPAGALALGAAGTLYGATSSGGSYNTGSVFEITQ